MAGIKLVAVDRACPRDRTLCFDMRCFRRGMEAWECSGGSTPWYEFLQV